MLQIFVCNRDIGEMRGGWGFVYFMGLLSEPEFFELMN